MFGVTVAIGKLQGLNYEIVRNAISDNGWGFGFLYFLIFNGGCAIIASGLVVSIAPQAAGSGIPEVKVCLQLRHRLIL